VLKSTKTKSASTEQVVSILDQNGNPNVLHEGYNALHSAAEHGSVEWVKVLLEYGANVNSVTEPRHENALHLATWQSDLEDFLRKLQILQQSHIDLNAQNNDGDTVLHLAIRRFGSVKAIEALLDAGASTERKDTKGRTPLWYAVFLKQEEKALK
jgi:ankyrin repeat protein